MAAPVAGQWDPAVARDLRAFIQSEQGNLDTWRRVLPDGRRPDYVAAIQSGNWEDLAQFARDELVARRADALRVQRYLDSLSSFARQMGGVKTPRRGKILASGRADWPMVHSQLQQELSNRGVPPDQASKMITQLESVREDSAAALAVNAQTRLFAAADEMAATHLAARMAATLALAVARFNLAAAPGAVAPAASLREALAPSRAAEQRCWRLLNTGSLVDLGVAAGDMSTTASAALFDTALPSAAALAVQSRSAPAERYATGPDALEAADAVRALLRAVALGHRLSLLSHMSEQTASVAAWRKAATLAFPSLVRWPRKANIASLAANPASADGKAVTVEGALGPVTIVHRGRKAISSAPVSDAAGHQITITIPYIKLDSGGMVPGAYVRVGGVWESASKEVTGAALLIDRLNYGDLGHKSWQDWATSRLRNSFEPTPHGLAVSWSWEPGADGAGNQLRYGTWFTRGEGTSR